MGNQRMGNLPTQAPEKQHLFEFWSGIWAEKMVHDTHAEWIEKERDRVRQVETCAQNSVRMEELQVVLRRVKSWKMPGTDNIQNFWYKKFSSAHGTMLSFINEFLEKPESLPDFVTAGVTLMCLKAQGDSTNPANYRPITCLQTFYKILTGCLTKIIQSHVNEHEIISTAQKGCRMGSKG